MIQNYYKIVTNNYLRSGGDGFDIFATRGVNANDYGDGIEVCMRDYFDLVRVYQPLPSDILIDAAPVINDPTSGGCNGDVTNFREIWDQGSKCR